MPLFDRQGYRIFYRVLGKQDAPPLILSHSLGATHALWNRQLKTFAEYFFIILYDHPGHGDSSDRPGVGTIADYAHDVLALMDQLGIEKAHFCGLSLGGMVGMRLALTAGDRLDKLILCSTTAKIVDPTLLKARIENIRRFGLEQISESVLNKWLTAEFCAREPETLTEIRDMFLTTTAQGYADTAEMICEMDLRPVLRNIANDTLVIYGTRDEATPPAWNRAIADSIAGARCRAMDTAHLANIEAPDEFSKQVLDFLGFDSATGAAGGINNS